MMSKQLSVNLILPLILAPLFLANCSKTQENQWKEDSHFPAVIYGEDTRKTKAELTTVAELQIAQSTVALMKVQDFSIQDSIYKTNKNYSAAQSNHYCPNEKFAQETTVAHCSGFLIGHDLIMTAGHCVENQIDCENTLFVFDYVRTIRPYSTPAAKVFRCQKLLAQTSKTLITGGDYALIQLDRSVQQRKPLAIDWSPALRINQEIAIYGYPNGLPLKMDTGVLRSIEDGGSYIKAEIDSFYGNSGSPLVDPVSQKVIGMLISGEDDVDEDVLYEARRQNSCVQIKRCSKGDCRGERGVLLKSLPESLKKWIQERSN